MAVNLIDTLKREFTDDVVGRIASSVGETPANTNSALGYVIPATVGTLAQKAGTTQGAADLFGMMQRGGFDGTSEGIATAFRTGTPGRDRLASGASLVGSLFGDRQGSLTDLIASRSGIRPQSAASLLGLIVPFVLNMVGREASASGGFNASSVARLLGEQTGFLKNLMPAGLGSLLGLGSVADSPRLSEVTREQTRTYTQPVRSEPLHADDRDVAVPPHAYDRGRGMGWLKWALPLLLLGGLLAWGLSSGRSGEPTREAAVGTDLPVGTAGGGVALVSEKLVCGPQIDVAPDGVERRLIAFIDDRGRVVDADTWFSFDCLSFESGSANLTPASQAQVRNIAEILRCYPAVTLKFGGYTDNTGDPAANLRLSQARAESARQAVISQGIDPARIEAEGYGQDHPVAANDTDAGRQRNRRIDIRVVNK
jgi:outer membrane protein OmpA-like peptidoglycan-associated protein